MRKFGLIGESLGHSFSKEFFKNFFEEHGIDAIYENIEVAKEDELPRVLNRDFSGFNVTIPYKEAIIPYLDGLSEEATVIGAVNVIRRENDKWIGHNSDAFGFHQSIKPFLTNQHERAIVFGSGGASKAVIYVLKSLGVDVIQVTRTPQTEIQFSYEQVNEFMLKACKLLVNCTPVGTSPKVNESLDIPYEYLTTEHLVVDLVYNPPLTRFLKKAKQQGATVLNGESMLKEQALRSWKLWNN